MDWDWNKVTIYVCAVYGFCDLTLMMVFALLEKYREERERLSAKRRRRH